MKKIIWIIAQFFFLPMSFIFAGQISHHPQNRTTSGSDPFYTDFKFDSAQLLHGNTAVALSTPRVVFNVLGSKPTLSSDTPASGFFLYKLDRSVESMVIPSNPFSNGNSLIKKSDSNIYGHLFQRLMQHLFIDLAGGVEPNNMLPNYFSPILEPVNASMANNSNGYSKNWFASASALFTHTWKEFAFNAHLGLTHAEANQDPMTMAYSGKAVTADVSSNLQNTVSFVHENAELSYRANSLFQPFVAGGLLQVVNLNNNPSTSMVSWGLPSSLTDMSSDAHGYKVGGGLSLNYKHYVLRVEQQYFQRGNLYRNNQSMLSLKVNLG